MRVTFDTTEFVRSHGRQPPTRDAGDWAFRVMLTSEQGCSDLGDRLGARHAGAGQGASPRPREAGAQHVQPRDRRFRRGAAVIRAAILTALALVLHVGVPVGVGRDAPACQVHVWDGNPPYDCHEPTADGDDA